MIKPAGVDDWGNWGGGLKRERERQTARDGWMMILGGRMRGYGTALCIVDHQPGWLVLWVGVRGATPASHSVAMGLLPWQQQSNSLANITAGP